MALKENTGPKTETFRFDPILTFKTSVTEGLITDVSSDTTDDRRRLKIEFKPDGRAPLKFIYPQNDSDEINSLTNIGDFSANKIYPARYMPTSPDRWLKNRRATVITYGEDQRRILWLRPNSN